MSESSRIKREANLSYEDFARKYLYTNTPVIVTDALRHWKAVQRWTPEFFKSEFGDMKFSIASTEYGQKGHKQEKAADYNMAQFIDAVLASNEERPAPYFRNRILSQLFPSLVQDIEPLPDYFQPNWLSDRYMVKHVGEVLNRGSEMELYIGGQGSSFPVLHYDGAGVHAFLMQIYGRKEFIVYSPDQEPYLYPSPVKANLSLVNSVDNPNLAEFPLFTKATAIRFVLEPGELLFVPSHWWHTTKMLTPSITISANVLNQSNWQELVSFVSRGRRNPLVSFGSRLYLNFAGAWRAWRDREWRKRVRAVA